MSRFTRRLLSREVDVLQTHRDQLARRAATRVLRAMASVTRQRTLPTLAQTLRDYADKANNSGARRFRAGSFMAAVERLIADGWVHSVEAWRDGALVGGVYGIHMNGVFFAESMFSQPPAGTDASKVCLVHLERHLRARGIGLLDCQFLTPHLERMGFIEVPRSVWRGRLHDALLTPVAWED